jgi:LDH2 family malate/lactate/ureidoglycolate dehydrogenase
MLSVAYLANQFPAAVEPYVTEEIEELRRHGIRVITGTVTRAREGKIRGSPDVVLRPVEGLVLARAV